jgi:hypothetical protein
VPILLAGLTAAGLTSALLGDNLWDVLSWLALGVPLSAVVWIVVRMRRATLVAKRVACDHSDNS